MKNFLAVVIMGLFLSGNVFADIEKNLDKLEKLLESGKISKKQYSDAKAILYEMENQDEQSEKLVDKNKVLRVKTYKDSKEKYEKNEVIFGKYRIYTHRPGGVKIRDTSNNKQLLVISDKFKEKYYNSGDKIFNLEVDLEELEIILKFKGIELLKWTGKYVAKHQANFFQVTTTTNEPFHYYITLKDGKSVALNIKKFDKKIDKAVAKAKVRLASKYSMTLEQIDYILKKQKLKKNKELQKIIGDEVNLVMEQKLDAALSFTIGEEMAAEFDSIIMDGMEEEFSSAVDAAIAEAVAAGVSAAAAAAAIEAMLAVYAAGGTDAEAMEACRSHAGDAC